MRASLYPFSLLVINSLYFYTSLIDTLKYKLKFEVEDWFMESMQKRLKYLLKNIIFKKTLYPAISTIKKLILKIERKFISE